MANYLVIFTNKDPATELAIRFLSRFNSYIEGNFRSKSVKEIKKEDVDWCDILVSVRTQNYWEYSIAKYAKKQNKKYAILLDDDFFSIPHYKIRRVLQYKSLKKSIEIADVILCTNDSLGERVKLMSRGGEFVKIDTAISVDEIKQIDEVGCLDTTKIVYYVNDGNLDVYYALVDPLISVLFSKYKEKIEWAFIGIHPIIDTELESVVKCYNHMTLDDFKNTLRNSGFSFGIAPLLNDEFSNGKYVNKFIEYTCAGLPCIFSDVPPYSGFIVNGESGLLVKNNKDEWVEAIERMINPQIRKQLFDGARELLIDRMAYSTVFSRMVNACSLLKNYSAPQRHNSKSSYVCWNLLKIKSGMVLKADLFLRIRGRLKCEGIGSLISYSFDKVRER